MAERFSFYLCVDGTSHSVSQIGFSQRVENVESIAVGGKSFSESFGVIHILWGHEEAVVGVGHESCSVGMSLDEEFDVGGRSPHSQALQAFLDVHRVDLRTSCPLENLVGVLEVEVSAQHQLGTEVLGGHVDVHEALQPVGKRVLVGGTQSGDAAVWLVHAVVQSALGGALHETLAHAGGNVAHRASLGGPRGGLEGGSRQGVAKVGLGLCVSRCDVLAELGVLHAPILGVVHAPHDGIYVKLCQRVTVPAHKVAQRVSEDSAVSVDVYAVEQVKEVVVLAEGQVALEGVQAVVLVQLRLEELVEGDICLEAEVVPGEDAAGNLVVEGNAVVGHDEVFEFIERNHSVGVPVHETLQSLGLALGDVAAVGVHLVLDVDGCDLAAA